MYLSIYSLLLYPVVYDGGIYRKEIIEFPALFLNFLSLRETITEINLAIVDEEMYNANMKYMYIIIMIDYYIAIIRMVYRFSRYDVTFTILS